MKQIIAVHDLSGFGKCSLSVVMPTLAAMGVRACALPTAYLSAHTAFPPCPHSVFLDLTPQMEATLAHWKELHAQFDGFYSGFLGAPEQMEILERCLSAQRRDSFLAMVDPVMGDGGKPYRTYTPQLCRKMAELAAHADLITPNLTEAAILLDEDYDSAPTQEKAAAWLRRLSLDGRRSVILTGLSLSGDALGAGCFDRDKNQVDFAQAPLAHGVFSGTGDLFASVAFGKLLAGESLPAATQAAVEFVSLAARATLERGGNPVEGADFEPLLHLLVPKQV